MDLVLQWLREHPFLLFAAIAILPAFAVPSSPLLILAGIVWGPTWQSCALALAAIALNITGSHLLAAGPARNLLTRIFTRSGDHRSPTHRNGDHRSPTNTWRNRLSTILSHPPDSTTSRTRHIQLITLIRFTPGIPLCVQNYTIGLLGAPLHLSLLLTIPTTAVHACAFVLTGGAILQGSLGILLLALSLLILATLLIHTLRKRLAQSAETRA